MAEAGRKVVVTGSIRARPERVEELLALSLKHVRRSRAEPGCISHGVYRNVEDPRLVFVEEWGDRSALRAHFALPASRAFVKAAAACASGTPSMSLYEVDALEL